MAIKIYCDICGKELKIDEYYRLQVTPHNVITVYLQELYLCKSCVEELETYLTEKAENKNE
jgi:hypothetical protein